MASITPRWRIGIAGLVVAATVFAACGGGDDDSADVEEAAARAPAEPTVVTGAGDITAVVDEYRELLGPDNGGAPGGRESGRRELTWDGVPDELAAPNPLPPDFFNAPEEPRARGAVLETPGDHVAVSANQANPAGVPVRFGDINPTYVDTFTAFSEEKVFSPVGSNVVNLRFNVAGTDTPAAVRGFGAVYTDVDSADAADFEFFDADDNSLGTYAVPVSEDGLSFLGVAFDDPIVARVRIVYGNAELGPDDDAQYDVAVMDDFIYGEPQPRER
ncbi:MAG: hypothetical protein ACRDY6_21290 [Acidimicrobiia bacterium]